MSLEDTDSTSIRGKPKSGRLWKTVQKQPSRFKLKVEGWKKTLEERKHARNEKIRTKQYFDELKKKSKDERELARKRKKEREKRKEENEKKGEVVQVIKDTRKIKKMSRKQFHQLEKR